GSRIFGISSTIPPDSWYGTLLQGTVNFQPDPSWLQGIVWMSYLAIVLTLYLRKPKPTSTPAPSKQAQSV
ncbi:MAG: iron transporter, partial [Flavobacterium sp.]|nr:iron transporter [Aeromicrobium sp.]